MCTFSKSCRFQDPIQRDFLRIRRFIQNLGSLVILGQSLVVLGHAKSLYESAPFRNAVNFRIQSCQKDFLRIRRFMQNLGSSVILPLTKLNPKIYSFEESVAFRIAVNFRTQSCQKDFLRIGRFIQNLGSPVILGQSLVVIGHAKSFFPKTVNFQDPIQILHVQ